MTEPRQGDELIRRYQEASAQDERRPGAQVRDAVRAHAQAVLDGKATPHAIAPQAPAANQSRWKLSLLASVALVGLTGLLVLQFERGTPEEKELVAGRGTAPAASPAPSTAPATPAPSTPSTPPMASAKPADSAAPAAANAPVRPSVPRPALQAGRARTEAARESKEQETQLAENARPSPPATAAPAPRSDPQPATHIESPSRMADATSPADASAPSLRESAPSAAATLRSAPAAAPPPTRSVSPAAPNAQADRALQTQRHRGETSLAKTQERAAQESLHDAARSGQLPRIERLIAQGARINAPDEAGQTPLMLAAINGHTAVVQRLLAAGANPALVDRQGLSALGYARRLGRDEIARMIEAGS